jgi:WD40 repeat protein
MSMKYSRDGRYLATASGDRTLRIWDTVEGRSFPAMREHQHSATVYALDFDDLHGRLAAASWDKTVSIWKFDAGNLSFERQLPASDGKSPGHEDYVTGVAFSGDGKKLFTVGNDKKLIVWDPESSKVLHTQRLRGVAWSVACSKKDRIAAAVWNPKGWVTVWQY